MRIKHALACRRPIEFSPEVQPIILTPSHGTLPSGHATEAFAMAFVLWLVLRAAAAEAAAEDPPRLLAYGHKSYVMQLMRQAARIAINRTVAGVHFPADSVAGAILGLTLGQYLVARASSKREYIAWGFDGEQYPNEDFDWFDLWNQMIYNQKKRDYLLELGKQEIKPLPDDESALNWLWGKALSEWK
jgi:membrane-associated phospholipid phosphatase